MRNLGDRTRPKRSSIQKLTFSGGMSYKELSIPQVASLILHFLARTKLTSTLNHICHPSHLSLFKMRFFTIVVLSLLTGILAAPVAQPEAYPPFLNLISDRHREALTVRDAEADADPDPNCTGCMTWKE
jgi:hypothetical protein